MSGSQGVGGRGERQRDLRTGIGLRALFCVEAGGRALPRVSGVVGGSGEQESWRNLEDREHKPRGGVAVVCSLPGPDPPQARHNQQCAELLWVPELQTQEPKCSVAGTRLLSSVRCPRISLHSWAGNDIGPS